MQVECDFQPKRFLALYCEESVAGEFVGVFSAEDLMSVTVRRVLFLMPVMCWSTNELEATHH